MLVKRFLSDGRYSVKQKGKGKVEGKERGGERERSRVGDLWIESTAIIHSNV